MIINYVKHNTPQIGWRTVEPTVFVSSERIDSGKCTYRSYVKKVIHWSGNHSRVDVNLVLSIVGV